MGFEADYRQACVDKLMSPTHLREMDVPDNALVLIYNLTKEQKWTKEQTKAASDRIRSIADLAPDWPKNLPRIFAWVYGGQPGAENAPRPLKITPWQNYFCGRLAPFPGTSQPAPAHSEPT